MKRKKIKWVGKMILITISLVILLTLIFFYYQTNICKHDRTIVN